MIPTEYQMIKPFKSLMILALVLCGGTLSFANQVKLHVGTPYGKVTSADKKQNVWVRVGLTGFKMEADKKRAPVNVAIVLDRSGSMRGQKLRDLKSAVQVFITILQDTSSDERVSLSSYATSGSKDVNMTSNLASITAAVNRYGANGFTAIGQGLNFATNSLESDSLARPFAEKTIILMTDGIENRTPFVGSVVPTAQRRNHTIYTITFGQGADQRLMRQVAADTGGLHFHADNGAQLRQVFLDIAQTLAITTIE